MMTAIEAVLQRFLASPSRRLIVIIITFGTGLAALLPAADEYLAQRDHRTDSLESLTDVREQVAQLDALEAQSGQLGERLARLEDQTVADKNVYHFRSNLVALTRTSGCSIRRIHLGKPHIRDWHENDRPVEVRTAARNDDKATYELRSQHVSLSVSGTLDSTRELLEALRGTGKMIHVESLALRPSGPNRKAVTLEVELIVFGLEKKKSVVSA